MCMKAFLRQWEMLESLQRTPHFLSMKTKSAEQNIISFLQQNPSVFAAAELQRQPFKNRNGTLASPKAISRRLQELAEQNILEVSYVSNHAHYQIREEHKKKPTLIIDESKPPIKDERGIWRP